MMAEKRKGKAAAKPKAAEQRNAIKVMVRPKETPDQAAARTLTRPEVNAAATIQKMQGDTHEVNALARELSMQVAAVNGGDLKRAEGMLISQAHTLDELFNNLARRAHSNMGGGYLDAADRYLRLALKAQSQCRTTLQTLGELKYPKETAFIRQQNVAVNQQVNNSSAQTHEEFRDKYTRTPAREKFSNSTNELLENHHERVELGTAVTASGVDPALETVGAVERPENGER